MTIAETISSPSPREAGRGSGRGGRHLAALVAVVLVAACCAHAQPIATRPYPAPSADALIAALSAQQAAVRGMNARVRATSWLGGERVEWPH